MLATPPRILALFGSRVIFGAERENIDVLSALRQKGCEVLCLVRHEEWNNEVWESLDRQQLPWRRVSYIDGWLPGWRLWILMRNPIAFVKGNIQFLRIVREFRPTHIHAFSPLFVYSFFVAIALTRLPLVYRCGDMPIRHRAIWRGLWRLLVARTNHFVAISRFIARELVRTGASQSSVEVIGGRPPQRVLTQDQKFVFGEIGPSPRLIAFVGQITERKGPHLLVEAFGQLALRYPDSKVLVAGRISDWEGDDWARALQSRTGADPVLSKRVVFLGYTEDIQGLLSKCCVLVVPSLVEEALGLVCLEAKQASIPSVVFPSGGLPEMISNYADGIVCKDKSVDELAAALEFYLSDTARAAQHGKAAFASLEKLGVDDFVNRWLTVYEHVH